MRSSYDMRSALCRMNVQDWTYPYNQKKREREIEIGLVHPLNISDEAREHLKA